MFNTLSRRAFMTAAGAALATPLIAGRSRAAGSMALKIGHELPIDHPIHQGCLEAARILSESSGGRLTLTVFPSGQFGSGRDMFQQTMDGSLDVVMYGYGGMAGFFAPMGVFEAPYLARDWDQFGRMIRSDAAAALNERFRAEKGIEVVGGPFYYGARHFSSNGRGFVTPQDTVGMKIRVPENPIALAMLGTIGASPTPMALSEVYLGLQTGVVDGQENPLPVIYSNKFFEVQSFLSLSAHQTPIFRACFNAGLFAQMSAEDRALIAAAFDAGAEANNAAAFALEQSLAGELQKQGMTVVESDRDAFRNAMLPMYAQFSDTWGNGVIETLQAL